MTFAAGTQHKKLMLHKHLGSGAFGSVFHATDILQNRPCAVKFVENSDPQQFKAHIEGQILQQCSHDNVVSVYGVDIYQAGGKNFAGIEMELMQRGSAESAASSGFLSIKDTIKIAIDVLFALEHTHRNGVLHRDIKPANIMLGHRVAKLSDFGLATAPGIGGNASAAGTPAYNAPEVHMHNTTNVSTDIFSVGMSIFQLFNNYISSDFENRISSFSTITSGEVIKRMGYADFVPRRIRTICNRACSPMPADRYQTAKDFRHALEGLRVAIDWHRLAEGHWQGQTYGKSLEMRTQPKRREVENLFMQNARRVSAKSGVYANAALATSHQDSVVYETTFAGI